PRSIAVPLSEALFVAARVALVAFVTAPVLESLRLAVALAPASWVAQSSAMLTTPLLLKVSEPKAKESPAWLPRSIDVPLKEALFVTARVALAAFVTAPVLERARLSAVLAPASWVALSSAML